MLRSSALFPLLALLATGCLYRVYVDEDSLPIEQSFDTVHIDLDAGDVDLVATTAPSSLLEITTTWHHDIPDLDVVVVDKTLHINGDCPRPHLTCSIDLVLHMPAPTDAWVETGAGDISASGLTGQLDLGTGAGDLLLDELDGDVVVDSGAGRIVGSALACPTLRAQTGAGRIDLTWVALPDEIILWTGAGAIDLLVPMGTYAIEADTGAGDVDVSGVTVSPSALRTIDADTGAGDITIRGWNP